MIFKIIVSCSPTEESVKRNPQSIKKAGSSATACSVQRRLCVPDAYIQQCTAHTERLNISMLLSTGCRETDALGFNSWNEGEMNMYTVPVCLSTVFGAVVVVALIGQTIWVSTLM